MTPEILRQTLQTPTLRGNIRRAIDSVRTESPADRDLLAGAEAALIGDEVAELSG